MRHQATVSGPPAASSRRLLVRFRDWSKREAAGTRSENAQGSTRRARASSDRREHGQLLPTAQATPPRLPLLFSWARGRLPCVCVPTCPTLAKCAGTVPSRHLEPSSPNPSTRTSWAAMWSLPTRRQVAVAPQWRVQWLLTRLHGDTALALSASAQGVPAPAALLVLKTLTEATAPCMLASFAPSRGHGPLGCPGRQRPLCLAGLSCSCRLTQA